MCNNHPIMRVSRYELGRGEDDRECGAPGSAYHGRTLVPCKWVITRDDVHPDAVSGARPTNGSGGTKVDSPQIFVILQGLDVFFVTTERFVMDRMVAAVTPSRIIQCVSQRANKE